MKPCSNDKSNFRQEFIYVLKNSDKCKKMQKHCSKFAERCKKRERENERNMTLRIFFAALPGYNLIALNCDISIEIS